MSAGLREENPLIDYLEELHKGDRSRELYERFRPSIQTADPWQVNQAIHALISGHDDFDRIETAVGRFIRACAEGLDKQIPLQLDRDHFLSILSRENAKMGEQRSRLSALFRELTLSPDGGNRETREKLLSELKHLSDITAHYRKIEYPLFSVMEECLEEFNCAKLMWHLHNLIIRGIKSLTSRLETEENPLDKEFNRVFGETFLKMAALSYREEAILYPVVFRAVPEERFLSLRGELEEFGTTFGIPLPPGRSKGPARSSGKELDLSVGRLLPDQIDLMLKSLPLDITFVDDKDRVRYYSQGVERIFPRSPGIIGREVQNCHPPSSLHVVQQIVDDLKTGKRKEAEFWLPMAEKFIHIRYLPLFEGEEYRGIIEVSQDIAPLRALEGEKRLL